MNVISETAPETKEAPGELELVRAFVNTRDVEEDLDDLQSAEELRDWLSERELMDPDEPVTEGDLRRAVDVREGLRALLLSNNGSPFDASAIERLDRAASRAGLRLRFHPGGCAEFEPDATGVDGALARLLAIVAEARVEGEWERLKACAEHTCEWAFYDKSKNRSKKWCSMETCGNVNKARAYRQRAKGSASSSSSGSS
jgi:predicted RNA-binding Zn ribbon-like protein